MKKVIYLSLFLLLLTIYGCGQQQTASNGNSHFEQTFEWTMVTTWPKGLPGLGLMPRETAKLIEQMSAGRLKIKVYDAGELVPAFGVFETVSLGQAEMGHATPYYWKGKIPASVFFSSRPFGFTAQEMNAWLYYGGGIELWRELYKPWNLIPFAAGNTGTQWAGWFRKPLKTVKDLQNLKVRMPGLGGDTIGKLGGYPQTIAGSELFTSLQNGVIDASEWVGPFNDQSLGLHKAAEYYYYPGWHEPSTTIELIVNADAFAKLPADLQKIIEVVAGMMNDKSLAEYTARNGSALEGINETTKVREIPKPILDAMYKASEEVIEEYVAQDEFSQRVLASQKKFEQQIYSSIKAGEYSILKYRYERKK